MIIEVSLVVVAVIAYGIYKKKKNFEKIAINTNSTFRNIKPKTNNNIKSILNNWKKVFKNSFNSIIQFSHESAEWRFIVISMLTEWRSTVLKMVNLIQVFISLLIILPCLYLNIYLNNQFKIEEVINICFYPFALYSMAQLIYYIYLGETFNFYIIDSFSFIIISIQFLSFFKINFNIYFIFQISFGSYLVYDYFY